MHFFIVISIFSLIQVNQAQTSEGPVGNCKVDDISADDWEHHLVISQEFFDTDKDKVFFESPYSNIKGLKKECAVYFCIKLDEKNKVFKIIASENFKNLDGDAQFERNSQADVDSELFLICDDNTERKLDFKITITDTNNNYPSFDKVSYEFTLPMPMPPTINITDFGSEKIIVKDIDFSNKYITFTADNDMGFKFIVSNGNEGSFSYILDLEFEKVETLLESKTFKLQATDSGKPSRSTSVDVTFNIDPTVSAPPPFTKPSYIYDYDSATKTIKARDSQDIQLEAARTGMKCTIQDARLATLFDVKVTDTNKKVDLSLKNGADVSSLTKELVQMTLQCFVDENIGTSETDVIISSPQSTTDVVKFEEKKYTGRYNKDNPEKPVVTLDGAIKVDKKSDDLVISLDDKDLAPYFTPKASEDGWTISVEKPLSSEMLKQTEIDFVILLKKKDVTEVLDDAYVTLLLPNGEEGVQFTEPFFKGEYTFDDDGEGSMNPIKLTMNSNDVDVGECELDNNSKYSPFFHVTCDKADDIELSPSGKIDKDLLVNGVVPLSMHMTVKLRDITRKISTGILLNLSNDGTTTTTISSTTSTTTENPDNTDTDDCSHTGWIVTTFVVFILFVIYIVVTVTYYVKRIRNENENNFSEPVRTKSPQFETRTDKRTSDKFKDVSTRRPTGFIRYNPDQDKDSTNSEYGDAENEVNTNTNANRFLNDPTETFPDRPEAGSTDRRNIGFVIPPPPPEPPM